jgi:hypothetical protein
VRAAQKKETDAAATALESANSAAGMDKLDAWRCAVKCVGLPPKTDAVVVAFVKTEGMC